MRRPAAAVARERGPERAPEPERERGAHTGLDRPASLSPGPQVFSSPAAVVSVALPLRSGMGGPLGGGGQGGVLGRALAVGLGIFLPWRKDPPGPRPGRCGRPYLGQLLVCPSPFGSFGGPVLGDGPSARPTDEEQPALWRTENCPPSSRCSEPLLPVAGRGTQVLDLVPGHPGSWLLPGELGLPLWPDEGGRADQETVSPGRSTAFPPKLRLQHGQSPHAPA
ncbi:hypothetical protein J1605_022480 [Eschrichtius robustus]|uniref:Uncharacterized protein n=1 Tax=Eschrichtius robustus TaxID=9764 RepID=A0AB34HB48_ESCRO|nr:hypothetical protein J1605_022480 [Eschrichtius robustus]